VIGVEGSKENEERDEVRETVTNYIGIQARQSVCILF
jgi:hypothetical protein